MKPLAANTDEQIAPLVVVTGAGKGVGFRTAAALAHDHGADVIAVSRDLGAWDDELHIERLTLVSADLSTEAGITAVQQAVGDRALFGLINNAGSLLKRDLGTWTVVDLETLFRVNAHAPLLLTQALLPALRRSPMAHVVNISSMGGFQGSVKFPGLAGYSASKAALACITECLAEELKATGVRCNCLCLGAVDTAMLREAFPGYQAPIAPEAMGSFIARFLFDGGKLLNGKVLPVSLSTP